MTTYYTSMIPLSVVHFPSEPSLLRVRICHIEGQSQTFDTSREVVEGECREKRDGPVMWSRING